MRLPCPCSAPDEKVPAGRKQVLFEQEAYAGMRLQALQKQVAMDDFRRLPEKFQHLQNDRGDDDPVAAADRFLRENGLELAEDSAEFRNLVQAYAAAKIRHFQAIVDRIAHGKPAIVPDASNIQKQLDQELRGSVSAPLLSKAVAEWVEQKVRLGEWTPKTANMVKSGLRLFREFAGDRPLNSYTKDDARRFLDVVLQLPSRHNMGRFKGKNLSQVLEMSMSV